MAWVLVLSVCANVVTFAALLWAYSHGYLRVDAPDVATLALTAATLVVAAVGVVIAIVTFVGYREINRASVFAAKREAGKVARDIAMSVAARTVQEIEPSQTSADEADEIARRV